jgi:hypothetical protein
VCCVAPRGALPPPAEPDTPIRHLLLRLLPA